MRSFLYNKKIVPLRYVFAKSTYNPLRAAASKEVAAADVGERVRIKRPLQGIVAAFFV